MKDNHACNQILKNHCTQELIKFFPLKSNIPAIPDPYEGQTFKSCLDTSLLNSHPSLD